MRGVLAKRYAQALFSIGLDDQAHEAYGQELAGFWASLKAAGQIGQVLSSQAYPKEVRSQALEAILAQAKLARVVGDFLRLLLLKGRFGFLEAIVQAYQKLLDDKNGLIRGTVTTAGPLDDSQLAALKSALGAYIGRRVEVTVKSDPAIIGGVVAQLGDLVLDGSLRAKLNRLGRLLGTT
ncbi:MAG: ATP synthase F1 subunit delta [Deltaproteobacteria bacterium]|jgi:F-type H+-transporting ATPase subunit delta|nr:ATP synthase F1 subunit delta [Deltaproteobacteria bacterium]